MVDAVVLAGGGAARLGGADKPAVLIGTSSMLDRVLDAAGAAEHIVVVGPTRPVSRPVTWCVEDPPGSGPVAALATGMQRVRGDDLVLVLAADLPSIAPAVPRLLDALRHDPQADCAVLTCDGRRNYLAAVWRHGPLQDALHGLPDVRGAAARQLYRSVSVVEVLDADGAGRDCDTWADVDAARSRAQSTEETS